MGCEAGRREAADGGGILEFHPACTQSDGRARATCPYATALQPTSRSLYCNQFSHCSRASQWAQATCQPLTLTAELVANGSASMGTGAAHDPGAWDASLRSSTTVGDPLPPNGAITMLYQVSASAMKVAKNGPAKLPQPSSSLARHVYPLSWLADLYTVTIESPELRGEQPLATSALPARDALAKNLCVRAREVLGQVRGARSTSPKEGKQGRPASLHARA